MDIGGAQLVGGPHFETDPRFGAVGHNAAEVKTMVGNERGGCDIGEAGNRHRGFAATAGAALVAHHPARTIPTQQPALGHQRVDRLHEDGAVGKRREDALRGVAKRILRGE